ncbi:MAG: ABC transporter substrate-binding protein [Elusimicrobiota bacterium]
MNKKVWAGIIFIVILAMSLSIFLYRTRKHEKEKEKKHIYERIVSLSCTTEILCDLGAEDKIAAISGIEKESPYYETLKLKPKCGGDIRNVNLEKVLGFQPDLVFCWETQADTLKERGLNVYATKTYDIEGVMELIMNVGILAGKETEAKRIVSAMREKIDKITKKVKEIKHKPLVYFEAHALGKTRSAGSLTHDLITRAGGINIAKDEPVPFPLLSQEFIIEKNPDIIIVEEYGDIPQEIKRRDGWQNIKAVKNNRVYRSYIYFTNYTPRCIEGLEQYAKWFHPEVFKQ